VHSSIATFGTYTVDEAQHPYTARFEASTYPNNTGIERTRPVTINHALRLTSMRASKRQKLGAVHPNTNKLGKSKTNTRNSGLMWSKVWPNELMYWFVISLRNTSCRDGEGELRERRDQSQRCGVSARQD